MTANNGAGDPEVLRAEIRQTRMELGETVQALAARVDIKARLKESAAQTGQRLREQAAQTAELVRTQAGRTASGARSSARDVGVVARRDPVPWVAVLIGAATAVVVALVLRGRRG